VERLIGNHQEVILMALCVVWHHLLVYGVVSELMMSLKLKYMKT